VEPRRGGRAGGVLLSDRRYFRQLLAGRDYALDDRFAREMANYVYAIGDRETGEAVLVDPAYAPAELVALLRADGLSLSGVLLTHYHADHAGGHIGSVEIAGIAALLEHADVPVHVQRDELGWVTATTGVGAGSLLAHAPGDTVTVGGRSITLVHTPGHTPGSQCLLVDGTLVTGDTLFLHGCGRTDLPGGDPVALYDSLIHRLAPLPGETAVFPGHAYAPEPSASLAVLRAENPVLAPLDEADWLVRYGA